MGSGHPSRGVAVDCGVHRGGRRCAGKPHASLDAAFLPLNFLLMPYLKCGSRLMTGCDECDLLRWRKRVQQ